MLKILSDHNFKHGDIKPKSTHLNPSIFLLLKLAKVL